MNRTVGYTLLIVSFAAIVILTAVNPYVLSDENEFLKAYASSDMLNVLGVVLAITLASAGQIHLTLNGIEEQIKIADGFKRVRANIKSATYGMIWLFVAAVVLLFAKGGLAEAAWAQSLFNGLTLWVTLWMVLILVNLTELVFAIKSYPKDED